MQRYQASRSPARILGTLFSSLLILSGLLIIGYSFLINDPFATLALFRTDPPSKSTMTLTVPAMNRVRSEEHTSELQSRQYLVCRLLLEKKKKQVNNTHLSLYSHSTLFESPLVAYNMDSLGSNYRSQDLSARLSMHV